MPYIDKTERLQHGQDLQDFAKTPGQLNYAITCVIDDYLQYKGLNYTHINDVLGALEGAKLEFYRRVVVPYEAKKMGENGDVYSPENLTYK